MTQLTRWDPFAELANLRRTMDRLFEELTPAHWRLMEPEYTFPVDVCETENEIIVRAALPGVKSDDVEISVSEGMLHIKGESRKVEKAEKETCFRQEIRYGAFSRSISLPTRVDYEQAEAEMADGILTVRLPKAEEVRPKTIKIRRRERELVGAASGSQS